MKNVISSLFFGLLIGAIIFLVLCAMANSDGMSSDYNHPVNDVEGESSSGWSIPSIAYYAAGVIGLLVSIATFRSLNKGKA